RSRGGAASTAQGDDRLRPPLRLELQRRIRQDPLRPDRHALPSALAESRPERPFRLFHALRAEQRRNLSRLQRARHRPRALVPRSAEAAPRIRRGHDRDPRGLAGVWRRRQRRRHLRIRGWQARLFLRFAHDGARPRKLDRDLRHQRPARDRREPALEPRRDLRCPRRAQRVHTDVLRALRGGVPARDDGIRAGGARRSATGAHAGRRDRGDPHRRRAARVAADAARGRALRAKAQLAARDLALILAIVSLWGFSFVAIKVGLREIPPFALAALRFCLAAVPLVFFIDRPRMPWSYIAGYGFAIGVVQFGLLFLGIKLGMPAGLSSLVIQLQIFFTAGLAIAFLGDRLHKEDLIGAAIATVGVVLLGVYKLQAGMGATLFGVASWARLLHKYPTALISPFGLLIPVSGLASGAIFLSEGLASLQLVGVALVLAGLAENVFGARLRGWLRRVS